MWARMGTGNPQPKRRPLDGVGIWTDESSAKLCGMVDGAASYPRIENAVGNWLYVVRRGASVVYRDSSEICRTKNISPEGLCK